MLAFYRKYWRTAFDIGLIVLTVYLIMLAFSNLYAIAAPIFLAFVIYLIIEPFAAFLHRRGMKKSIASALSVMLFVLVILGTMLGAGIIFTQQISDLIGQLPKYRDMIIKESGKLIIFLQHKYESLPPDVSARISTYISDFAKTGEEWATSFLSWVVRHVASLSTFIVNFGIAIVLAYFLSTEIDSWKRLASDKTPRTFKEAFNFLKDNVFHGIGSYLKSQFKLISISFCTIFISLILLNVSNAFSISLLSAFFDILPILGVPVIFVPWIVYLFVIGNTSLAIWLTVVLGIVLLTRQILEPKITGDSLGVSAFTMLSFMIISLSLFGVAGLILSPVLLILIKALMDQGYLTRWIRFPAEEIQTHPLAPTVDEDKS
ncbi:sporulation integral membrane protein YtvI [Paenibacillus sp. ACRRX]|uniref:sporulation integral membrane protein YtvI n=1 Tax=unclassified Paenibacillus TaxID=185978 RepID=UPI001EF4ACE8|nr:MULTISPECIES: sporulation integral membrane protein YtvI [unclassified Paenibacillus]MCG7410302.1 sporulation integral membrane protein YtvI [Paenibacillus sp. ACRRX]MDK8181130.1 sporulation integral membrane protein YtvI [Paenibacillus sp. UMB4589-SE434]